MPVTDADPSIEGRRFTALIADGLLALGCALVVGVVSGTEGGKAVLDLASPAFWGAAIAAGLGFSFFNQVVLTLSAQASIGKLLTGLRVVRTTDAGRPRPWQSCVRWLFGLTWLVIMVPIHVLTDSDLDQQDAAGLRIVRRRMMRRRRIVRRPRGEQSA